MVSGVCLYLFMFARPAPHGLQICASVCNRLGKPFCVWTLRINSCQPNASAHMNLRHKNPVPSPVSAARSGSSAAIAVSPPHSQAAACQHVESDTPVAARIHSNTHNATAPAVQRNFLAHEVCDILKIGRTTLFKLVKSRELVPLHITARIRVFPQSTIEAFLASKEGK